MIHRIENETAGFPANKALAQRRQIIKETDEKAIIATPANSSTNELVMEAARLSILNNGKMARITYGNNPHVELIT